MATEKHSKYRPALAKLAGILTGLPWIEIVIEAWKIGRKMLRALPGTAMYEVLEYETTLELKDPKGMRATFKKRQIIRYLQNNVIAFQDQAWGDGEILVNYRCTPGTPVDQYRSGYKTFILISRREVKNRGDRDEYNIQWGIRGGFQRGTEQWETLVTHPTKRLGISVIFPKSRPPTRISLIERNRQRTHPLAQSSRVVLPDGRRRVSWKTRQPRLHETYILEWEW